MRFYSDDDFTVPVEWYFVPDDRPYLTFSHAFMSRLYERDEFEQEHLGERYAPHPWRGGTVPSIVPTGGLCGTVDQWQNGTKFGTPLPDVYPGTTVSKCCKQPAQRPVGGFAMGHFKMTPVFEFKGGLGASGKFAGTSIDTSPCLVDALMPWSMRVRWFYMEGPCMALDGLVMDLPPGNPLDIVGPQVLYTSPLFQTSDEFPYWGPPVHGVVWCIFPVVQFAFGWDVHDLTVTSSDPLVLEAVFEFIDPSNGPCQFSKYLLSFTPYPPDA